MKGKAKAGYIAVRALEALQWVSAAVCLCAAAALLLAPGWFFSLYEPKGEVMSFQTVQYGVLGGLNMVATGGAGFDAVPQALMAVGGAASSVLGALVFRRLGQIIRLSHGGTPFQKPVVDRVRQIGWLVVAEPLVMSAAGLLSYVVSWPRYSLQIDVSGIILGIVILALSQIFAYGVKLEDDVEGLL